MHAVQKGGSELIVEDTCDAKASFRNWYIYVYFLKGTYAVCIRIHPVFVALQPAGVLAIGGVDKTRKKHTESQISTGFQREP